jgi:hypothetical protein
MEASAPPPSLKSLSCPNCGGTVQLRGLGRAQSVVCIQCLTVLDASGLSLRVLQNFKAKERFQPLIPLGTRGKLRGELYEVIGFQVRELYADGMPYSWSEYVLFNPYRGFRYLTEYNGHWNDVIVATALPAVSGSGKGKAATFLNERFKHFQNYGATTIFVMGEFPWQVRVGEKAECDDYVHPPRLLSAEKSDNEVTWSVGEYTPGAEIWKNFQLKGEPPDAKGVFANQPSPHAGAISRAWQAFAIWLLALLFIQFAFAAIHANKFVFQRHYRFAQQPGPAENSFVTEVFELAGRTSNVEVILDTDLNNDWAFFNLALINEDTGRAIDFSREVSYYYGRDSDGNWTEGRKRDSVVLPSVPAGRYYLRVEPEPGSSRPMPLNMHYQIQVRRDVTTWIFFVTGAILLLIPPIFTTFRSLSFESKRWSESDYSSSGDD